MLPGKGPVEPYSNCGTALMLENLHTLLRCDVTSIVPLYFTSFNYLQN